MRVFLIAFLALLTACQTTSSSKYAAPGKVPCEGFPVRAIDGETLRVHDCVYSMHRHSYLTTNNYSLSLRKSRQWGEFVLQESGPGTILTDVRAHEYAKHWNKIRLSGSSFADVDTLVLPSGIKTQHFRFKISDEECHFALHKISESARFSGYACNVSESGFTDLLAGLHIEVVGRGIVMLGSESQTPSRPADLGDSDLPANMPAAHQITFSWEGTDGPIPGSVTWDAKNWRVSAVLARGKGRCSGSYAPSSKGEGMWSMDCEDGTSASGIYKASDDGRKISGDGRDSEGRQISFRSM